MRAELQRTLMPEEATTASVADDDIPLPEFMRMVGAVIVLVGMLIFVELGYRWLVKPANTLLPLQLIEAWVWTFLSNIFWPGSAELVYHSSGVPTQVNLIHSSFYGGFIPLYVSDECAGIHEIVFLGAMMLLTPGLSMRDKTRHLLIAAGIILALNMGRLIVLYPLAIQGCVDAPGQWGCDAPLWRFHEFILRNGFLIALVVGWSFWFRVSGGQKAVAGFWKRLPAFRGISMTTLSGGDLMNGASGRTTWRIPTMVMGAALVVWMFSIFSSQSFAEVQALGDGCGDDYTTRCTNLIKKAQDSAGRVIRGVLIGFVMMVAPLIRLCVEWADEEE